jgi:hypothetical protein
VQAARGGVKVLAVERAPSPGGTSTLGGVHAWEPGVSTGKLHRELADLLGKNPKDAGVGMEIPRKPGQPFGFSRIQRELAYESTLRRSGLPAPAWRRFHFEPAAMARAMGSILDQAGVQTLYGTRFVSCRLLGQHVAETIGASNEGEFAIQARVFIDASADLCLARAAQCQTTIGEEARETYGEDSAPAAPSPSRNGVSLIFRARPIPHPEVEDLPEWAQAPAARSWIGEFERTGRYPGAAINEYPNGDLNVNILPVMEGSEYPLLDGEGCRRALEARVRHYWRWLQAHHGFERYRLHSFAPSPGIRETWRLMGRRVLTESDIRAGLPRQENANEAIALADHALDTHGRGKSCRELEGPYGIPFACLLPKERGNLLVACRGASFSHLAASSCRLSRTMMALGEVAGIAAARAVRSGIEVAEVSPAFIREKIGLDLGLPH